MTAIRRGVAMIFLVAALGAATTAIVPAQADEAKKGGVCTQATPQFCGGDDDKDEGDDIVTSDGNGNDSITTDQTSCSVYANGGGMGMYCTSGGGGDVKTLRERYGDQKFQRCRYRELPPTVEPPHNAHKEDGHYMLMTCLENVDFDTYNGGPDRTLSLSIVWVPNGTDTEDRDNDINDFLWHQAERNRAMPVPVMQTRPNSTPLVGIPTYFTFRWLDPVTNEVVAEGPYNGRANGAGYRQLQVGDVIMRARATKVVIDPRQEGIAPVTCVPDAPYTEGALPKNQPADACSITFKRSSASARKYATKPIPSNIKDAFYADVTVSWEVTFGEDGGNMRTLGDGFNMRMRQVLPVQEVQAPNQPPAVIY